MARTDIQTGRLNIPIEGSLSGNKLAVYSSSGEPCVHEPHEVACGCLLCLFRVDSFTNWIVQEQCGSGSRTSDRLLDESKRIPHIS
jgi:hypothetical protein